MRRLRRTCKEAVQLLLEGLDRPLRRRERLAVRLHLLVCKACPRFVKQVALLREASARWRQYSQKSDDEDREK